MSKAYERLFRQVLFPFYETVLCRRKTLAYLAEYERNQWLAPDAIEALRWRKLKALLDYCYREVPYYRRRWDEAGLPPERIGSLADFARLPVLTKADIRAHLDDLIAPAYRDSILFKTTGGSTGEPLRFGFSRESHERRSAVMWRGYGWAGARMGRRTLYLWGGSVGNPGRRQLLKDRVYHAAFARRILIFDNLLPILERNF